MLDPGFFNKSRLSFFLVSVFVAKIARTVADFNVPKNSFSLRVGDIFESQTLSRNCWSCTHQIIKIFGKNDSENLILSMHLFF